MAEPTPSFIKRYPWLFFLSGAVVIIFAIYAVLQAKAYHDSQQIHYATIQDIRQQQPTSGSFTITGGRLNYVYGQAVDFRNDADKDAGSVYDTYVPVVDDKTKQVVMLALLKNYSPKDMWSHIDDPAETLTGAFLDPNSVPDEIFNDFTNRHYSVPKGISVFEVAGGVPPEVLRNRLIIAGLLTLVVGGGPWGVMYLISRPKPKRKNFSDRYPTRRVY